jgi:hypothetical protein
MDERDAQPHARRVWNWHSFPTDKMKLICRAKKQPPNSGGT